MRLPRDVSGDDLARALRAFGYYVTRQTGSHMRLTTVEGGEHHVTVPRHNPLRLGTLVQRGALQTHPGPLLRLLRNARARHPAGLALPSRMPIALVLSL